MRNALPAQSRRASCPFIGLVGLAPQASASASSDGTHCSAEVERVKPGEKFSRVKSRTCSDTGTAAVNRSGRTLLMTWYEHAEYGGDNTDVYGAYGPCNADGYVLRTGTWWRSISSFIRSLSWIPSASAGGGNEAPAEGGGR
ncbi:hypothetical protein SAMN05428938_7575 [Streptomyces sp. KS_5]|nr:hypothetical protein SAMN05428938_7575 [Streptomyces sp. KS_5]